MACKEIHVTHSEAETAVFSSAVSPLLERSAAAARPILFWLFDVASKHRRFVYCPEEKERVMSVSNGHAVGYFGTIKPV
jgi:hypothetical protein